MRRLLPRNYLFTILGIAVGVALWLLYKKTQIGAVVRAGVDDREQVNATGINVDRLFVMVSALASFLAGLAGVAGGAFLTLYPGAEWEILVYALVVVIVGGLGSLEGAMIGALIVAVGCPAASPSGAAVDRASPKSSSRAPVRVSITLPGLRSRWTMSLRCAADNASAISMPYRRTCSSGRAPRASRAARVSPSRHSMTRKSTPS